MPGDGRYEREAGELISGKASGTVPRLPVTALNPHILTPSSSFLLLLLSQQKKKTIRAINNFSVS
jgi:hypothetical protein